MKALLNHTKEINNDISIFGTYSINHSIPGRQVAIGAQEFFNSWKHKADFPDPQINIGFISFISAFFFFFFLAVAVRCLGIKILS